MQNVQPENVGLYSDRLKRINDLIISYVAAEKIVGAFKNLEVFDSGTVDHYKTIKPKKTHAYRGFINTYFRIDLRFHEHLSC